jgi:uncharacterized protein
MSILDDLCAVLVEDAPVREVLIGVHWTAVCSRGCGLASTLTDDKPHGHDRVREVGRLHLKTAVELTSWASSDNLLEASLGVAAMNSLIAVDRARLVEANAVEILAERGRDRDVALVGHFPFIPELRRAARKLWVIEQHPSKGEYPAKAARRLLPRAAVVAITGTALINHTLEGLLALCRPQAYVMVLGPSTPLSPVLFDHGVSALSGVLMTDEEGALRTIRQGAMFQQVEGVRLVTMVKVGGR